jgi:hypothetical protein
MKEVVLSNGQVVVVRPTDELTEGQSRRIEIARSRGSAVFQKFGVEAGEKIEIPPSAMDKLSDEDFAHIRGFEDTVMSVMILSVDEKPLGDPTDLPRTVYNELNEIAMNAYGGIAVQTEGPDEKINPLAGAVESTASSTEAQI